MKAKMSNTFTRISKGYAFDVCGNKIYTEVWIAHTIQDLYVRFFAPYLSYTGTVKDVNRIVRSRAYTQYHIPRQMVSEWNHHDIGNIVDRVVSHLNVKVVIESRKRLTDAEKSAAKLVALQGIGDEDVEFLLGCDICDLPQAFWDYVEVFKNEYDSWCKGRELLRKQLNTFNGLERMLSWLRNNPIPSGLAISSIEHYLTQQSF